MKKKLFLSFILILVCSIFIFAKRLPPPKVEPVTANGYVYSSDLIISPLYSTAVVYVESAKNGQVIKKVEIYKNVYNIFYETDVQDVWINKMELIDSDTIRITNEANEVYDLDLKTYKVKKIRIEK